MPQLKRVRPLSMRTETPEGGVGVRGVTQLHLKFKANTELEGLTHLNGSDEATALLCSSMPSGCGHISHAQCCVNIIRTCILVFEIPQLL